MLNYKFIVHEILQYVEENERLRAILSEWSARAAKVLSYLYIYRLRLCG